MSLKNSKFAQKLDSFFHVSERGSKISTEIIGGLTTFMAMAYILMVNANMFAYPYGVEGGNVLGVSYGAVYIATALSAIIGSVLIGLLSKLPLAQASGMGLNAFFVYTICLSLGFTYANALVLVLIDGIVFIVLTLTGLRKKIFEAIPSSVRVAIPAGIGLFIAFLGLQNAGIVVGNSSTLVTMVSLNVFNGAEWKTIMPILVAFFTLIVITVLSKKNVKGAILIGIVGGTALYYLLGLTISGFYDAINVEFNPFTAFQQWGEESVGQVFVSGFDFSKYLEKHEVGNLILMIVTSSLAFCLVDMFDTLGTLYGACSRGNLLNEKGEVPNMNKAMLADAIATTTGAVCGTSTVTTFVECSSGIAAGAKTGLASMVTSLLFFVAMFLSPVASLIPNAATSACLIYVGVLMMNCVKDIKWTSPEVAIPAFLTLAMMPFTYNISYGIAFGLISYVIIMLLLGKFKEIKIGTYVLAILFAALFFFTH